MTGEVQPQDKDSGLVRRTWTRVLGQKPGKVTEETLEGERVRARFMDPQGYVQRVAGTVRRSDTGELVVESWADGVRKQTAVTRDADVDVIGRRDRP